MQKTNGQNESQNKLLFEKSILRIDEVAVILGQSKSHVYRLTSQKKIPFRKKGRTLYFMSQEIFDWVNEGVA
jgi:excisionase family DNA binding protein